MAVHLVKQRRSEELNDKYRDKSEQRFDIIRIYAEPLIDATTSLYYRLDEIVIKKQGRYLRANVPVIPFLEYKKISTLYRIAVLLGWMRAIKRERGYLDPRKSESATDEQLIGKIEAALADGYHIERHRLDELLLLWRIPSIKEENKVNIAYNIDGIRADYLAKEGHMSAVDLTDIQKKEIAQMCADVIRQSERIDIPGSIVDSHFQHSAVILGIKEAYIYRDWQAAIGDFMLKEIDGGLRRFTVMGYGDFEAHYLKAYEGDKMTRARRWFNRLQAIVYDLDMELTGSFDARRDQLINLHESCNTLRITLEKRMKTLENNISGI